MHADASRSSMTSVASDRVATRRCPHRFKIFVASPATSEEVLSDESEQSEVQALPPVNLDRARQVDCQARDNRTGSVPSSQIEQGAKR